MRNVQRGSKRNVIAVVILTACVLLLALSALAMNVVRLPPPTGPLAVGTRTVHVAQAGAAPGFTVDLWYPAAPNTGRSTSYGLGGHGLKAFVYRRLIRTAAKRDARIAEGAQRFPLVVYASSWGGRRTENTALVENLVSHGYIVVALDDVAFDTPADPALDGPLDLSSAAAFATTLRTGFAKRAAEVARASAVLDRVLAGGLPGSAEIAARIDRARIGILGYSFGGAVALDACRHDPRFRAAMNLDGWLWNVAGHVPARANVPYFEFGTYDPPVTAGDLQAADPTARYSAALDAADAPVIAAQVAPGGYVVALHGAEHASFTDAALYAFGSRLRSSAADPDFVARTLAAYSVAFFDQSLRGRDSALLDPKTARDARIGFTRWPRAEAAGPPSGPPAKDTAHAR